MDISGFTALSNKFCGLDNVVAAAVGGGFAAFMAAEADEIGKDALEVYHQKVRLFTVYRVGLNRQRIWSPSCFEL